MPKAKPAAAPVVIKHWSDIPRLAWGGNAEADADNSAAIEAFKEGKSESEQNFIEILANYYECGEDVLPSANIAFA